MGKHPRAPDVVDVADAALTFLLQFPASGLKAMVEFDAACPRKFLIRPSRPGSVEPRFLLGEQVGEDQVLAVDDFSEADLDVPGDYRRPPARRSFRCLLQHRLQACRSRQISTCGTGQAIPCRPAAHWLATRMP